MENKKVPILLRLGVKWKITINVISVTYFGDFGCFASKIVQTNNETLDQLIVQLSVNIKFSTDFTPKLEMELKHSWCTRSLASEVVGINYFTLFIYLFFSFI